ncbi:uncharacterized protein LOC121837649 [Ixodes scapularis]|uniref:uncharacterized protein LOC121837649 n=1 Tax=Ixodes scapularis TaxID=6945 RepID=UPI001C38C4FC|nr:uncharacterized protein LOC121837649 [Ixodes scapularis]
MYGFRPHLSTQDILLQLKEEVLDSLNNHSKRSILTLDIKGAFDNISHQAILQGVASTNCGERTYKYFASFLTNRTATVGIGHLRSDTFTTIPKGTPQGSVVSPLLFNIAMKDLPPLLQAIPNLHHAIYADDLTLWVPTGSTGDQQDALQAAIQVTQQRTYKKNKDPIPDPELTIDNQPVPNVPHLRILGLNIPKDGSGAQTILFQQRTLTQLMHLIRRVSHRHFGLQETDTLRIIQAILISRVTYGTPYLALKSAEKEKLNVAIRQTYKAALGLPPKTATRKLLQLGVHNTWEEIQEAHRVSQFTRLKLTSVGRATLYRLGYTPPAECEQKKRIPLTIRHSIKVAPIPRNMHPIYNKARREARIRALKTQYEHSPDSSFTRYTDASPYPQQPAHAVSVTDAHCKELTAATILTTSIETAEELAIALAATTGNEYITVLTDSQAACRNFLLGRISPTALKVLQNVRQLPELHIVWTPGHESFEGSRAEATAFRRLQTNSYSHGTLLHAMYPTLYSATCKFCSQPGTLYHMVWECQQTPSLAPNPHATYEQWVGQLTSSDLSAQRSLVERARKVSADQGFPD